jgi:hypothetical protein
MRRMLTAVGSLALAGVVVLAVVAACESPAAQRERAAAERVQAEAIAYQLRQQADTEAAAERATVRQMERDAAHQRALDLLPYVLIIAGGLALAGLGLVLWWDLRSMRPLAPGDRALLLHLQRLELSQAERDRQLWRAIAALDRRTLPAARSGREVVIVDNKRQ